MEIKKALLFSNPNAEYIMITQGVAHPVIFCDWGGVEGYFKDKPEYEYVKQLKAGEILETKDWILLKFK